ncbi:MAG: vWA domain-containing protein [Candidatus Acidulodesulfobacterium sp.]
MSKLLDVKIIPHRSYLMADTPDQKLFIELKLEASRKIDFKTPLSIAFVIDTSGSMREIVAGSPVNTGKTQTIDGNTYNIVTGGDSKIGILIEGLKKFVNSAKLKNSDRVSLIKFDDKAEVLLPFVNIENKNKDLILKAIDALINYSGGTSMGAGMKESLELISKETGNRKIIMLTDGQTSDEDLVKEMSLELAKLNIPLIAVGIGEDWNENLISFITDKTQGKPYYASVNGEDDASGIIIKPSDIPDIMIKELEHAVNETLSGVSLTINTVKDVKIDRITKVYPEVSEVDINIKPHFLGSINPEENSVFIIESTLPERKPLKSRLMQLSLTYDMPDGNYRGENPPEDVIVEFTMDESKASVVNNEVMQWVQQRNVGSLLEKAIKEAGENPLNASKTLDMAKRMTVKLGNSAMTKIIERAQDEIKENKTISIGTSKTLRIGSKTKTIKISSENEFSDEQIRKLAGI